MQLNLRQRGFYGWEGMGDITSDTAILGTDIATDPGIIAPFDPSTVNLDPGYNITTTPGIALTPDQLAQQQTAAEAWLLQNVPAASGIPAATALSTLALSAAQIASGLRAGTVRAAPGACPSGYQYSTGQCVPGTASVLPGVSNSSLALIGVALFAFLIISQSGGRRR